MKKDGIQQLKSLALAVRIVNVYKYLAFEKKEFILSKQFLQSVTSIGVKIEETTGGQSESDFFC
jgi:four helix bundle protein